MWISENDKEVECFHPVCAQALTLALDELGMDNYEVQHHRYVGSLEMDLVVANKTTDKIFCVVEVKRTIGAVFSTRYQYQAMSYVQSLCEAEKETNYYILTNLECSCLFKYSASRPAVYNQILEPGVLFNYRFTDVPECDFREALKNQYKDLLLKIVNGYNQYVLSFSEFAAKVQEAMPNIIQWNTSLAFLFYEYIRGSFQSFNRDEFRNISFFRNSILAICLEASKVNFKGIFGLPQNEYNSRFSPSGKLLSELYSLGANYKDADAICNIMHSVVSQGHEHEGEVATDIELAQVLMELVHIFCPKLDQNDLIGDPAAGSGTLLSAATKAYQGIHPSQLVANDINRNLLQLLTLRLGLTFPKTITKDDFPVVQVSDIAQLDPSFFKHIKVLVLNPPYLAATAEDCIARKRSLCGRIRSITGHDSVTNLGQASLECPFIELVTAYASPGTVIACIIPNTHLTGQGPSDVAFRSFLLSSFGLTLIFTYPLSELFERVAQNTSIIIGIKDSNPKTVSCVKSIRLISEINPELLSEIKQIPDDTRDFVEVADGIIGCLKSTTELEKENVNGWNFLNPVILEGMRFLDSHVMNSSLIVPISNTIFSDFRRGCVGNQGASDLLFISTLSEFYNAIQSRIVNNVAAGMRNSDYPSFLVGKGDRLFFDTSALSDSDLIPILNLFLQDHVRARGRQRRDTKSTNDYIQILRAEQNHFVPANSVLLPRASRRTGSAYLCTERTFISTNFMAVPTSTPIEAKIIASWMCSIFYQIELETVSKNNNGMRKVEKVNIDKTHIPDINALTAEETESIIETPIPSFLDLREPSIREIDKVWAKILTKKDNNDDLLNEAVLILVLLSKNRES